MLRILTVDSCTDFVQSFAILLRHWGHDVRHTGDGATALAIAQTFQPDVVFTDIFLPELSGYELASRLCRQSQPRKPLLVAVTSLQQEKFRRRSHEAGFDFFCTKPVEPDLVRTLLSLRERRSAKEEN